MTYAFPYSDENVLARLADGLVQAGIAGSTLSPFQAGKTARLEAHEIRGVMFGKSIEGHTHLLGSRNWRQSRTTEGELQQDGKIGPMLLATSGSSRIADNQLCDLWQYRQETIESCASVFRHLPHARQGRVATHFLTTEFGVFPFSGVD